MAFTVKLSTQLIAALRAHARGTGRTLSEEAAEALGRGLFEDPGRS